MGTTIRARTGAFKTRSADASRTAFSVGGRTSQNVKVKSKGVWEIEQKFAYVRGSCDSSSGTIVKLICLRSLLGFGLSFQNLGQPLKTSRAAPSSLDVCKG